MTKPTTPRLHIYGRVSTWKQKQFGVGEAAQLRKANQIRQAMLSDPEARAYWLDEAYRDANFAIGEDFIEPYAVSASKKRLLKRKAGQQMMMAVEPGDAVIFSAHDRCFRSLADQCITLDWLKAHQVEFVVANLPTWNKSTVEGMIMRAIMGVLAETESVRISQRTQDAHDEKVARGEAWGGAPWGHKYQYRYCSHRKRSVGYFVLNHRELAVMRYVAYLRERCLVRSELAWSFCRDKEHEIAPADRTASMPPRSGFGAWRQLGWATIERHIKAKIINKTEPLYVPEKLRDRHYLRKTKHKRILVGTRDQLREAYGRWNADLKQRWSSHLANKKVG